MRKKRIHDILIGFALLVFAVTGCGMQTAENGGSISNGQQDVEDSTASETPAEVISLDALMPEEDTMQNAAEAAAAEESVTTDMADEEDSLTADMSDEAEDSLTAELTEETDDSNGTMEDSQEEAADPGLAGSEGEINSPDSNALEKDASAWENAEIYYSNSGYQITIPYEWKETVSIVETESGTDFICTSAEEENYTGLLFTLQSMTEAEYFEKSTGSQMITKVAEEGEEVIAAVYPQEESYDKENSYAKEKYETAAKFIEGVLGSYQRK